MPRECTEERAVVRPGFAVLSLLLMCAGPLRAQTPSQATPAISFERDIRPIFRAHCFDCHGATDEKEGSLDLRLVRFAIRGGDSGPALVPGQPDASLMLERVRSGEMPPGEARLSDHEIQQLDDWIRAGAPTLRPEPESIGAGVGIAPEDREFWSFQPIRKEAPPQIDNPRVRTPIDSLVLASMPEGLDLSPDADRETLVRRLKFDLTGLPATADELARWAADTDPDWYERLLNELLDSEHYGERWGRHWLDVAGYADSEGYTVSDAERPWAWKYRDYVIRSFNADKPFNEFVIEQLAGDELAGPITGDLTPRQIELLTATSFLRMAADGTGSGANDSTARNQVMADTIKIVSTSLLGLSVACAQCHDHRYDPIPQADYYALRAVFEPALDWQAWKTPAQRRISLSTQADRDKSAAIEAEAQQVATEKSAKQAEFMKQALDKELMKYDEPLRGQLREAYETEAGKRTAEQQALLKQYPSVNITPGVLYQYLPKAAEELKQLDQKIAEIRARKPAEEFLRVLQEPAGHHPETKLFHRGDFEQPRDVIAPAGLTIASPEGERTLIATNDESLPTTGRRLAYARWLTSGKHPLVARVIVNRVWMHHFGQGLVQTPADFGRLGVPPSHPELLDWLAQSFMENGWSLKTLHRQILNSTVWRQTSARNPAFDAIDPENRYLWRQSVRRLDAETLRDHMLSVAGQLDRTLFGPPVAVSEDDTGQVIVSGGQKRRSLYIKQRRSQPVAMLQAFDAPVMETNCERRAESTVATQSLMLMNGDFTLGQAQTIAARLINEPPMDLPDATDLAQRLPEPEGSAWSFGYGSYSTESDRVDQFTALPHWTGSAWQGGAALPDPHIEWVILNANGGHPGSRYCAIRRWNVPAAGRLTFSGKLQHGSPNGDGVRGRLVSSRTGLVGEWVAEHNEVATSPVAVEGTDGSVEVQAGDTIDLVVDCREHVTSDSFSWTVEFKLVRPDGHSETHSSASGFHGPLPAAAELPGRLANAWVHVLGRRPDPDELTAVAEFAGEQLRYLQAHPDRVRQGSSAPQMVLENLCQVLLSSNEFLYVD